MKKWILSAVLFISTACGSKSSNSSAAAAATSTATALSVSLSVYTLPVGGSATVSVSGGSGVYASAVASQGSLIASTSGIYIYTAPASTSSSTVTITVVDSLGATGYTSFNLTGATSTTTTTNISCTGTYSASVAGNSATLVLVDDVSGYTAGYFYMFGYYYPVVGTCNNNGSTGTISLTDLFFGWSYTGSTTYSGSALSLSGTLSASGSSYAWSATSQTALSYSAGATDSCEGRYSAVIAGNTGTLYLIQDGYNRVAGYLQLQGYYYALTGTCSSTSVSLTNQTTGSPYYGTVSISGTSVSMSGTFTANSTTYSWSAAK